jgi:hypothetical protein
VTAGPRGGNDAIRTALGEADASAAILPPHFEQNFDPARLDAPHDGQAAGSAAPHASQNRLSFATRAWQAGHSISHLSKEIASAYITRAIRRSRLSP